MFSSQDLAGYRGHVWYPFDSDLQVYQFMYYGVSGPKFDTESEYSNKNAFPRKYLPQSENYFTISQIIYLAHMFLNEIVM